MSNMIGTIMIGDLWLSDLLGIMIILLIAVDITARVLAIWLDVRGGWRPRATVSTDDNANGQRKSKKKAKRSRRTKLSKAPVKSTQG